MPTDPPLPKHAYIYIEAGARMRSGHRAWLVMAGNEVQRQFGGPDARQLAHDWVVERFGARPYEEVENPLVSEELQWQQQ